MTIISTAFHNNKYIPNKYTCDGENVNPPLTFSKVTRDTKSLVLIVEDPDAPMGVFTHWVVYDIPSSTLQILEDQVPAKSTQGMTDFGKTAYGGPCPPSGTHRYFFKLFALDSPLNLSEGATKDEVQMKMEGHILESSELIGLYKKKGGGEM
ncbi:MAG: YbhB/YbcL family Raf kinase inhibitor-like protein [Candidatus Levybacteria bacterium]|nr:YbhB/YbcL family Raf kinase inhibitor-like protein [Candidatus Levybacteria bacterium]